jgi:hypothetical protein
MAILERKCGNLTACGVSRPVAGKRDYGRVAARHHQFHLEGFAIGFATVLPRLKQKLRGPPKRKNRMMPNTLAIGHSLLWEESGPGQGARFGMPLNLLRQTLTVGPLFEIGMMRCRLLRCR